MKALIITSRILLGLIFTVFGLNGFLHFIPMPPPSGAAAQFAGAMYVSHYFFVVLVLEVVAGVLLLVNRFALVALVILGPILVNIALFHITMAPHGYAAAVIAIATWSVLFYRERAAFAGLFSAKGVS
jgi:putative oxidoreductase